MMTETAVGWRRSSLPGILGVAATYVYFLLWAQFGFLELIHRRLDDRAVEPVMAAMGLTGLAVSLLVPFLLRRLAASRLLPSAFVACAVIAPMATLAQGLWAFALTGAAIGASTAILTVTLATHLRHLVRGRRFGLAVGAGTGLAYFVCNLPPLFEGSPQVQSLVVAGVCVVGAWATFGTVGATAGNPQGEPLALSDADYRGLGFLSLVLGFLALVWLDSAAFVVIQETLALKGLTWGSGGQKMLLGSCHLVAALLAGWLIDRGFFRSLLLAAFGLFVVAFVGLEATAPWVRLLCGPIYTFGISFYSTALVVLPAYGPWRRGLVPVAWRAAWVYGIGGWLGSALGVGMGQNLHRIPRLFLLAAGLLLLAGWWLRRHQGRPGGRDLTPRRAEAGALASNLVGWLLVATSLLTLVAVAQLLPALDGPPRLEGPEGVVEPQTMLVAQGRQVYIAEGCIHCHSQYVRPGTADAVLWGPARPDVGGQGPPLYGNRRQGPDLSNVGLRRSRDWQRLHLISPRRLTPSSRMPSYGHLFAQPLDAGSVVAGDTDGGITGGVSRGDALVAYLDSLGRGHEQEAYGAWQSYRFAEDTGAGASASGAELFAAYCTACHGAEGAGDGPLAGDLGRRPAMNLRKGSFWLVSWGPGAEARHQALARLIKFGLPGTAMPGHEYLSDGQIADLVAYVETLSRHAEGTPPTLEVDDVF